MVVKRVAAAAALRLVRQADLAVLAAVAVHVKAAVEGDDSNLFLTILLRGHYGLATNRALWSKSPVKAGAAMDLKT